MSQLKLVNFDCSSNRINKLPLSFREMVTLIELSVDNNPLELPPANVNSILFTFFIKLFKKIYIILIDMH